MEHNINIRITVDGVDIDPNPREVRIYPGTELHPDKDRIEREKVQKELEAIHRAKKQAEERGEFYGQYEPEVGEHFGSKLSKDRSQIEVACSHLDKEISGLTVMMDELEQRLAPILAEKEPESGCNSGEVKAVPCPLAFELENYATRYGVIRYRLEAVLRRLRL